MNRQLPDEGLGNRADELRRDGDGPIEPQTGQAISMPLGLYVVGGIVLAVVISALTGGVASALTGTFDDLRVLLAGQVGLWLGLVPAVWGAARSRGETLRAFARWQFRRTDPLWALLGPLLQLVIAAAYAPFVSADELQEAAQRVVDLAQGQVVPYVALCASTVVGAPIIEELFFRGLVLRSGRSISTSFGVVLSAVLFAAVHLQALQFPALAAFGALCAFLTIRYDRLGPATWLHVGFNGATMAAMAWDVFR